MNEELECARLLERSVADRSWTAPTSVDGWLVVHGGLHPVLGRALDGARSDDAEQVPARTDPPDCAGPSIGATSNTASYRPRSCGFTLGRSLSSSSPSFCSVLSKAERRVVGRGWRSGRLADGAAQLGRNRVRSPVCGRKLAQRPGEPPCRRAHVRASRRPDAAHCDARLGTAQVPAAQTQPVAWRRTRRTRHRPHRRQTRLGRAPQTDIRTRRPPVHVRQPCRCPLHHNPDPASPSPQIRYRTDRAARAADGPAPRPACWSSGMSCATRSSARL